jgi:hypothetical protein
MQIGLPVGITLLEFEIVGEDPQEIPQQDAQGEGEQVQEELHECLDYKLSSYLKGKPWSILSLLCFININLSSLCLIH